MAKKPTYEDLEQRIKQLEKESTERKQAKEHLRLLSSASTSIILLWTLISQRSHVAVPSPSGLFLVVTRIIFVGRGTGPAKPVPVFLVTLIISSDTSCNCWGSFPIKIILAFSKHDGLANEWRHFEHIFHPRRGDIF